MPWQNPYSQQPPQQYAQQQYAYPYGNAPPGYYNYSAYAQQQSHPHPYHAGGAYPGVNTVTVPPPPPPRPETFYCAACDKTCESAKALRAHTESHVNCSHPGCTFSGSRKVVSAHFAQKHGKFSGEGLKEVEVTVPGCQTQRFEVCVGNDAENVKKWIEERKRNWPSRANVARKAAEKKRRFDEGAVSGDQGAHSKKAKWDQSYLEKSKNNAEEKEVNGLTSLVADYGSSESDEDEDEEKAKGQCKPKKESAPPSTATATSPELDSIAKNSTSKHNQRHCRFFLRGKCNNGDKCSFLHDIDAQIANKKKQKGKTSREQDKGQSLLRKLLDSDVRRETSLTLQCLRYIQDCNFYRAAEDL